MKERTTPDTLATAGGHWLCAFAMLCVLVGHCRAATTDETEVLRRTWQELRKRKLRLLPVPKQIRFTNEKIVVAGPGARDVVIVLMQNSERGQIAANEIVSRMKDFGTGLQKGLPVVATRRPGAYNIVLENRWPNTFTRDMKRPAEAKKTDQAYGLYPTATGITLAGQGELGMLYAAVTLRYLIEQENGKVVLHAARVVDWPDFKNRSMGWFDGPYHSWFLGEDTAKYLANMVKHIDFLFRIKANGIFVHSICPHQGSLPNTVTGDPKKIEGAKAVNDYARKRGIITNGPGSPRLGEHPKDKDRPGFDKMLQFKKSYGTHYHSLARHDLHRNKARNMAEFCRRSGYARLSMHAIDTGGLLNPELWEQREELTRRKYGNDRAQADADMFNIYTEALRNVGADLVAIPYPYSSGIADVNAVRRRLGLPDTAAGREKAQEVHDRLRKWAARLNEKLALGVPIVVRESSREALFKFFALYPGRPMVVDWWPFNGGRVNPLLPMSLRAVGNGYAPDRPHGDALSLMDAHMFCEHVKVCGSEYAWNTRFPGWSESVWGGDDDQAAREILAERAAVGLWGYEAGMQLKELFRHGLSLRFVTNPKKEAARISQDKLPGLIRQHRDAAQKACGAMDRLWARHKAAKAEGRRIMDDFSYPFFVQYYGMLKAANAYANVHYHESEAMAAISAGEMARGMEHVAEGRQALMRDKAEYDRVAAELAREPLVVAPSTLPRRYGWNKSYVAILGRPDLPGLEQKYAKLEANKEKLYEQYNIPAWFRKWFEKRKITAVRTTGAITLDGDLSEPCWNDAPRIEHFVALKQFKVMEQPCVVRLLHDADHLYVGVKAAQPLLAQIRERKRATNAYKLADGVELFFVRGDRNSGKLYQFAVDTAGNLWTGRKPVQPEDKGPHGWDSGGRLAVKKGQREWTFELAIPFARVGGRSGEPWHILIGRNLLTRAKPAAFAHYASSWLANRSFHTRERYAPLTFGKNTNGPFDVAPAIECSAPKLRSQAIATGTGTLIEFGLKLETKRPLQDVAIRAEVLDRDGTRIGTVPVTRKPHIPVTWSTQRPIQIQLQTLHKGVKLKITAGYRTFDGEAQATARTYVLGDPAAVLGRDEVFAEGLHPNTHGLAAMAYCDVNVSEGALLSPQRGTVEFWVLPRKRREWCALFHYGRQGRDGKRPKAFNELGRSCVAAILRQNHSMNLEIRNHEYERRYVQAPIKGWNSGRWQHFAYVWDLNDNGKARLEIYHDGQRVSGEVKRKWKTADDSAMEPGPGGYAFQLGSLNSGHGAAGAVFDEVRIWNRPRYSADFVPSRGQTPLADGLLHFAFENTLAGQYRIGGKKGTLTAIVGPQTKGTAVAWE